MTAPSPLRPLILLLACSAFCSAQPENAGLSREAASKEIARAWKQLVGRDEAASKAEIEARKLVVKGTELRWLERRFGDRPKAGWPLFISMHGGGGAPARVNDQQWRNQIRLYEPTVGIVVAPRAPGNTWDLWHRKGVDELFDRLVEAYVIAGAVDPERVHLLGYSAGGDGVYQLAPRWGDRLASAAMMAGHPNETRADGLRNLPFQLFMGGKDTAYDRHQRAADWGTMLEKLREADPEGYEHRVRIYPDQGHWMSGKDREALPWMLPKKRKAWPRRVVWLQDDVTRDRFAWLARPQGAATARERIIATCKEQTIAIETEITSPIILRLSDALLDLDREVLVTWNGKRVFSGPVPRTKTAIEASLTGRRDRATVATASLRVAP